SAPSNATRVGSGSKHLWAWTCCQREFRCVRPDGDEGEKSSLKKFFSGPCERAVTDGSALVLLRGFLIIRLLPSPKESIQTELSCRGDRVGRSTLRAPVRAATMPRCDLQFHPS